MEKENRRLENQVHKNFAIPLTEFKEREILLH